MILTYLTKEENDLSNSNFENNNMNDSARDTTSGETHYHHSSSSRSHSSSSHRHSNSMHGHSSDGSRRHHSEDMFNSDAERRGENIIYKNVRKNKIFLMIKRGCFCTIALLFIIFVIYSIFNSSPGDSMSFFSSNRVRTEELNELKIKVVQYEERIKELENKLAQYEGTAETQEN